MTFLGEVLSGGPFHGAGTVRGFLRLDATVGGGSQSRGGGGGGRWFVGGHELASQLLRWTGLGDLFLHHVEYHPEAGVEVQFWHVHGGGAG